MKSRQQPILARQIAIGQKFIKNHYKTDIIKIFNFISN